MKSRTRRKSHTGRSSQIALVASMLAVPMLASHPIAAAFQATQQPTRTTPQASALPDVRIQTQSLKHYDIAKVVGMKDGSKPVFENSKHELFWLDALMDLHFVTKSDAFIKIQLDNVLVSSLEIVGADAQGRLILKDSKNQKFFLGQDGKMNFVSVK